MKNLIVLFLTAFCLTACSQNNTQNPFGLTIINNKVAYKKSIEAKPENELIEIKEAIPTITLDIRYATKNNFMKQVMYKQPRAFARKPVVEQLKIIQAELAKKGYGLKIFDAYRPYAVTVAFYEKASDKNFVANPAKGSKHNRGCAVDLTIIDLKTGKDVPMPTPYDSFAPEAAPHFNDLPPAIIKNRDFLISTMQSHGFKVIYNEWWHFDFNGWQNYDLMDIPFQQL
ncbi:M15 family metallopeptidase [Pedobacter insulae]|uniref:D-alanyl-D-alanine dipeptidase n=1 Tax=Pedobacter insulae TaxID=414048 RepID=A0A1I2XC19_9SPHI|nr:M15 family metallopeptidase [Pedobacter insulae]SFH11060.1 D-alanyl-D-alanine dipeptidase [Pedobacter insulae]